MKKHHPLIRNSGTWTALLTLFLCLSCASMNPLRRPLSDAEYHNRVKGAWLGKCIGGALGMPIEWWSSEKIEKTFGPISNYVGYFDELVAATTPPLAEISIPKDGQWHTFSMDVTVPNYDTAKFHACPAIGIPAPNNKEGKEDGTLEIRNLRFEGGPAIPPLTDKNWGAYWATASPEGKAVYIYNASDQRQGPQYLRLNSRQTKSIRIQPGTRLKLTFDAQVVSGNVQRFVVVFDNVRNDPIPGFGPDDDTTFEIVGLLCLQQHGPDLSCRQIGKGWIDQLPPWWSNLAEGMAIDNMKKGIVPPQSGEHSLSEAIGGQMRGEIWGLICPGRPDLAAEYARRDGVVAHARNGVYAEQFIAAMIAASFKESRIPKLIETGLRQIPQDSEYARVVRWVIQLHQQYPDYRDTLRELLKKYPNVGNPVFGDAGVVVLGLLYGNGDFEKTLLITASCGQDTDCDTANVAALLGCIHGARAIPAKWKDPIADEFRCYVKDHPNWSINDLAAQICKAGGEVKKFHGRGVKFTSDL